MTFSYTFVSREPVFFALYYPFPYSDCQRLLDKVDRRVSAAIRDAGGSSGRTITPASSPTTADGAAADVAEGTRTWAADASVNDSMRNTRHSYPRRRRREGVRVVAVVDIVLFAVSFYAVFER